MVLAICLASGCRLLYKQRSNWQAEAAAQQRFQQAVQLVEGGQYRAAEQLLAELVKEQSDNAAARYLYAISLRNQDRLEEAKRQLLAAARLCPDDPAVFVALADVEIELQQILEAQRHIAKALELASDRPDVWLVYGRLKRIQGDLQEALACFYRVLALDEDNRAARWELAEVYQRLNQPHRVLVVLDGLAALYPPGEEPADLYALKGDAYLAMHQYRLAAQSFSIACAKGQPSQQLLGKLQQAQKLAAVKDGQSPEAGTAVASHPQPVLTQ